MLTFESLEQRQMLSQIFYVENTNRTGDGSLKAAIDDANLDSHHDIIELRCNAKFDELCQELIYGVTIRSEAGSRYTISPRAGYSDEYLEVNIDYGYADERIFALYNVTISGFSEYGVRIYDAADGASITNCTFTNNGYAAVRFGSDGGYSDPLPHYRQLCLLE